MNLVQLLHEGNSCAPVRCKQYSFDVNQQAQSLSAWQQKYNQHGAGQFNGYLDEIKLPGLHLFEEFTSHVVRQECCVDPDAVWIGFSSLVQRPKINGLNAERHQLMIRSGAEQFELTTPREFHIFGIVIERELFSRHWHHTGRGDWQRANLIEHVMPQHGCWPLVQLIRDALNPQSLLGQTLLAYSEVADKLPAMLRRAVLDRLSLFQLPSQREPRSYHTRRQALRRLHAYCEHHGDYPQSIARMCEVACVSERTLQYCFEQELGVSPMTFLRECRLNTVRRTLLDQQETRTISEIALSEGFYHLATFNHYYKQLFAETPSQTRERAEKYRYAAMVVPSYLQRR